MKNKKIIISLIFILLIAGLIIFIITHLQKNDLQSQSEYTPEEEISENQMNQTMVALYFIDAEKKSLKSEGRLIPTNNLLSDPYKELVILLTSGPKTSGLENALPNDTRILETTFSNHCATLNFSPEILNFSDETQKYNIINCLLNTLTQLNEVNSIKILINGEINENFKEEYSDIISNKNN